MDVAILVVDDEKVIGKTVSSSLKLFGYKIFVADSVREAIELLQINQCDIVITDKNMPGLGGAKEGGLELLRYIKTNLPDTEVIIITGFPSTESTVGAIKLVRRCKDKQLIVAEITTGTSKSLYLLPDYAKVFG